MGTLLDGFSAKPLKDVHVVYDAKSIRYVGSADDSPPADLLNPGQAQPDVELRDFTLLPGLIDAHAHLFLEGGELDFEKRHAYLKQTPKELLRAAHQRLEKLVRIGVIAIRDAGDKHGVGLALSELYGREDNALMPYVDSPGAAIHHKGNYGGFMAEPIENHASLKDCIESRIRAGADRIKLIATGNIDFREGRVTQEPQMSAQEVAELVNAAKGFGKQTFAHASGDAGIEHVIAGEVDSVEHGFFIRDDQLARMRDQQIAWVPTFAPVQKQIDHAERLGWDERVISNLRKILEQHAASLVKAHEMGVRIIAGSDAGSYGVTHGLGFLDELELMERAGLPALAVINAATGNSSERLGYKENFGQIRPGYRSRFILTRYSPLEGITNLRNDKQIVFDGTVYDSTANIDATGL
ncbi:MAG: amidohydrolase family protein [candidate division KSB1 bacterium]|nr:amidohydrolase family protein [candidate division KSB1 bacterium]MDZ7302563.1 amidohydrolase family protein [candidate division KSB1 bacterium]MDZ7310671.1 amidohydrolase family protein [candidate division KSB1 bacterium]